MNYTFNAENYEIGESSDKRSNCRYVIRWRGEFVSEHLDLPDALRALAKVLEEIES